MCGLLVYVVVGVLGYVEVIFNFVNCLYVGVGCLFDCLVVKVFYLCSCMLGCVLWL